MLLHFYLIYIFFAPFVPKCTWHFCLILNSWNKENCGKHISGGKEILPLHSSHHSRSLIDINILFAMKRSLYNTFPSFFRIWKRTKLWSSLEEESSSDNVTWRQLRWKSRTTTQKLIYRKNISIRNKLTWISRISVVIICGFP